MDRIEIKKEARDKVHGNVWTLFKPILVVILVSIVLSLPIVIIDPAESTYFGRSNIWSLAVTLLTMPLIVGLLKYYLAFVRGKKFSMSMLPSGYKDGLLIVVMTFIINMIVSIGMVLLIVPGIIAMTGLAMVFYLIADGRDKDFSALSGSWRLMNGYKWNYAVLMLSFLGWILLACLTFGLLLIWLLPYVYTTETIYYDRLRKVNAKALAK